MNSYCQFDNAVKITSSHDKIRRFSRCKPKDLFLSVVKTFDCRSNCLLFKPLPDWSKLKKSAYDNFKFDENSRKFFKWVENTVGKGEIARYQQFLI